MKRTFATFFILCLVCLCIFADSSSVRLRSMGGIGIAVSDPRHPAVANPASLYFLENDSSFVLDSSYSDSFLPNSGETFPTYPGSGLKGTFMGKRISFSIGFDYSVESTGIGDGIKYYNVYQTSEIRLDFCAGYGNFGAGIEVYGGSTKQRVNVPIHQSTALSDFVIQTYLSPYDRRSDSEYLQINLGFMYGMSGFTFGLMFDDILDNQDSKTALSWDTFVNEAGIGVYYVRDEYGRRGSLNHFGFSAGVEVSNLFRNSTRTFHVGLELSYMLLKDYGFYLRTGYEALFSDFSLGTHSFGVGSRLDYVEFYLNFRFPLAVYRGLNSGDRFTMELAAAFSF